MAKIKIRHIEVKGDEIAIKADGMSMEPYEVTYTDKNGSEQPVLDGDGKPVIGHRPRIGERRVVKFLKEDDTDSKRRRRLIRGFAGNAQEAEADSLPEVIREAVADMAKNEAERNEARLDRDKIKARLQRLRDERDQLQDQLDSALAELTSVTAERDALLEAETTAIENRNAD